MKGIEWLGNNWSVVYVGVVDSGYWMLALE
jgi:hypothetical protein